MKITTVEFRFFEPPREMEIGSKNREFEKSKVASNQTYFTVVWLFKIQEGRQRRYITLCVNHLYLPTKRAFKTKRKFKDLSQFRQNKNQYCIDTCVSNFARTLDCISFPLFYQKKVPYTRRFKGTAKFGDVLRQELEKCN